MEGDGDKDIFWNNTLQFFSVIILGTALQLEKFGQTFSSFSLRPLLPSIAVEDRNSLIQP